MSSSPDEQLKQVRSDSLDAARASDVDVTEDALVVTLADGRVITTPLAWFPRLEHATAEERAAWQFHGEGEAIWWEPLDDGVEVAHLLLGWQSGESQASLQRWLDGRKQQRGKRASA